MRIFCHEIHDLVLIWLKYWYVCGAPTTSPVIRTGCTVMLAVGTIKLF